MQPVPRLTTKDCDCGSRMEWTERGFFRRRWRLECVCGRAGPWRGAPEYEKLGPPPIRGGSGRMLLIPDISPFEKAERALWGQKWTADQADKLRNLVNYGEAAGPPEEDSA